MEREIAVKRTLKCAGLSAAVSLTLYLALIALTAYLAVNGRISEDTLEPAASVCAVLAALAGTLTAGRSGQKKSLSPILGTAAFAGVALLLGAILLNALSLHRVLLFLGAAAAGGALVPLLFGGRGKRRKNRRVHR